MEAKVAGVLLQCVYDGCLSTFDMGKERRPYHKHCTCALHRSKKAGGSNLCCERRKISFPTKQSWSQCSMAMSITHPSSASSVSATATQGTESTQMGMFSSVEENDTRDC